MRRPGLLLAALVLAGSVLVAGPASAHASLLGTDPTEGQVLAKAPSTATLSFDEPVRSQSGGVHVFDAKGQELHATSRTSDSRLVVDLPESVMVSGTFVIAWRVISADGHPVAGALTFSVLEPSATITARTTVAQSSPVVVRALLGATQALVYLGVFGACGLVFFLLRLLPAEGGLDQVRLRLMTLAGWFGWVVLAAVTVLGPLTSLYQRAQGLRDLLSSTTWKDAVTGSEAVSSVLLALGVAVAVRCARSARPAQHRLALVAVAVTLLSLSLVGHTRSVSPLWLMVAADLSHVAAGSIWFGGLIGLVISLRRLTERPRIGALVLGRFSMVAAWLLVGVTVAGSVLAWRILETWGNLVHTDFGRVLLVKVGVVALVAVIAGWNRYRLLPGVLADQGFADRGVASRRMRHSVRLEAVLLIGVLGLTGFLVDRSPVPSAAGIALPGALDSSTFVGRAQDVLVVMHVDPASVGRNTIVLQLQDAAGNPVEPAALPGLSASLGDLSLGDQAVTDVDSGTYRAIVLVPKAGTWEVQVSVRLSEFDNPVVTLRVPVSPAR